MHKTIKALPEGSLPLLAVENMETTRPIIVWKHASKHMAFSSKEQVDSDPNQVVLRFDGVAYDPETGTFYQTPEFGK